MKAKTYCLPPCSSLFAGASLAKDARRRIWDRVGITRQFKRRQDSLCRHRQGPLIVMIHGFPDFVHLASRWTR